MNFGACFHSVILDRMFPVCSLGNLCLNFVYEKSSGALIKYNMKLPTCPIAFTEMFTSPC